MSASKSELREALKESLEDIRRIRTRARWGLYRLQKVEARLESGRCEERISADEYDKQRAELEALRDETNGILKHMQHQRTRVTGWLLAIDEGKKHLL